MPSTVCCLYNVHNIHVVHVNTPMFIKFEEKLGWFTRRLLQIRMTEVEGVGISIPFKLSEIKACTVAKFSTGVSGETHLEELIEEIRQFYIENSGNTANGDRIKLAYSKNKQSVKIFGLNSKLLRTFITEHLKSYPSLFETRAKGALFYVGSPTGVTLNATQQTIFARFRSAKNQFLSYNELFEICAVQKGTERERAYRVKHSTKASQDSVARSAISALLKAIKKSAMLRTINNEHIISNDSGLGYQLIM